MSGKAWDPKVWDATKEQHDELPDGLPLRPIDPPRSQALEEQPPFTPEESKRFLEQMQLLADEKRTRDEALADEREAARAWLSPNMRRILSEIDANVADLARVDCAPVADAMRRIAEIMAGLGALAPAQKLPCETSANPDGADDAGKPYAPVVNQTLTAAPDIVETLSRAATKAILDKSLPGGATEKAVRAVLAELAATGGGMELCPEDDELADVFAEWASRKTGDDERAAYGRRGVAVYTIARVAPIIAAKDAAIAEQARTLAYLHRAADDAEDALTKERDAALAEVARLKAEAESMAKRVRILEIAPKAAWWANDKLGCGVLITDADNAARVIAGVGANATDDWAKAVLEYAAREGLT